MKNKSAVALGRKRFKSKEEAQAHIKAVQKLRWANKTEEDRKKIGQMLKEARLKKRLKTDGTIDYTTKTHIVAPEAPQWLTEPIQ